MRLRQWVSILIRLDRGMVPQIEAYWHAKRLRSRSEAIRKLIAAGLAAERKGAGHK